jgi:serralysin
MTTVTDIKTQIASGLNHIDALLDSGPGWNFLAPSRTVLTYTFSLDGRYVFDKGPVYTGDLVAFNTAQQAAAVSALALLTQITGIEFQPTTDGNAADIHFGAGNLVGATTTGYASSRWEYNFDSNQVITKFSAFAYVYLDNVEFKTSNSAPSAGTDGYEVLLHELGHALGLKHPFEGDVQLPSEQDSTALTLMSYTDRGGPYSNYSAYDVAALMYLYGGDGLGGALGHNSNGVVLIGTAAADNLIGTAGADRLDGANGGDDRLTGGNGNDTLIGGDGLDTAVYTRPHTDYTVTPGANGNMTVQALSGNEGLDMLSGIERIAFGDQSLAFDLDGAAGTTARFLGAVFGPESVSNARYVGIGLAELATGATNESLMFIALDARLGGGYTYESLVSVLYENLAGQAPSTDELNYYVGTLNSGQYNAVSLALMAAALPLNEQNIDLVGLAAHGLAFS